METALLRDLFQEYEVYGFQDIWFEGLDPPAVTALFRYAASFRGGPPPASQGVAPDADSCEPSASPAPEFPDDCMLIGFRFLGESFDDVCVRIEDEAVAVDFDTGLDRWHDSRIEAFVAWLRLLWASCPGATLTWAHEGCNHSPHAEFSLRLRAALRAEVGLDPGATRGDTAFPAGED